MLPVSAASTADTTLEEVFAALSRDPSVVGILLTGSTATGKSHAASDIDAALVVRGAPTGVPGIVTTIEGKFAEFFIYSPEEIASALAKDSVDPMAKEGWIINWLRDGRIVHDAEGLLGQLRDKRVVLSVGQGGAGQASWYRLNYNLVQNARYFRSDDKAYLEALDFKLSYAMCEALAGYFNVRDLPWTGEKDAVRWLDEHDPEFMGLCRAFFAANDRAGRMAQYERVVAAALAPVGGVWNGPVTAVMPGADELAARAGLAWWDGVVKA